MDEYVKVTFPARRQVQVDGNFGGYTNKVFQVQTGHHSFGLDPKNNCRPQSRQCLVQGTLPEQPMIIEFEHTDDE